MHADDNMRCVGIILTQAIIGWCLGLISHIGINPAFLFSHPEERNRYRDTDDRDQQEIMRWELYRRDRFKNAAGKEDRPERNRSRSNEREKHRERENSRDKDKDFSSSPV